MKTTFALTRAIALRYSVGSVSRSLIAKSAVAIILVLSGSIILSQSYVITNGSMESSLLIGDYVLVDKFLYAPAEGASKHLLPYRHVQRGDIIVFRHPLNIKLDCVKRVIGVSGDTIRFQNKHLILNGKVVEEPYAPHNSGNVNSYNDNFPSAAANFGVRPQALDMLQKYVVRGELVVPPGYVFALGDNREDSDDSRYWGLVPRANIEGAPIVIYWSLAPEKYSRNPDRTFGSGYVLTAAINFATRTRWSRTFSLVHSYPLG